MPEGQQHVGLLYDAEKADLLKKHCGKQARLPTGEPTILEDVVPAEDLSGQPCFEIIMTEISPEQAIKWENVPDPARSPDDPVMSAHPSITMKKIN